MLERVPASRDVGLGSPGDYELCRGVSGWLGGRNGALGPEVAGATEIMRAAARQPSTLVKIVGPTG